MLALSDDTGIIQHATFDVPNRSTGYCTDDVSRAFIVALQAAPYPHLRDQAIRLGRTYLSFLYDAQLPDGRFHNFMAYDRRWLDDVGSEDAWGRAVWSLGYGMRFAPLDTWRTVCRKLLAAALPAVRRLRWIHARTYATLGLAYAAADAPPGDLLDVLRELTDGLLSAFAATQSSDWPWFEETMTYDNARFCEAVVRAGSALDNRACLDVGLETLGFLESVTFEGDRFVPVGNSWYRRGGERSRFDQQPLEAAAMVDAELAAFEATGDRSRLHRAEDSFAWYLGRNDRAEALARDGGCCDGFSEHVLNCNMGAESTLAYLSSAFALAEAQMAPAAKYPGDDRRNRRPQRRPA